MSHTTIVHDDEGREWVLIHNGDWSGDVTIRRFSSDECVEEAVVPAAVIRKSRAKIPSPSGMTIEEAQQPRKIVQLIPAGERLFCECDDGTFWELNSNPLGRPAWQLLPKPGLPTPLPTGWDKYAKDQGL